MEKKDEPAPRPGISVVTASFNQGQFLEETMRSVLEQGYPNLEYIVVDGGSTDGSVEIIRKYESRLAFWCSEPDGGQAEALNKGFGRTTGEIFAFLNSDDLYLPGALERVAEAYRSWEGSKEEFWVAFPVENFDESGVVACEVQDVSRTLFENLGVMTTLNQPGVFWSRELHRRAGGFDTNYHLGLDRKFFLSLQVQGYRAKAMAMPAAARFRLHAGSKSNEYRGADWYDTDWYREFLSVTKEFLSYLPKEERRKLIALKRQDEMSDVLRRFVEPRDLRRAIRGLLKVAGRFPSVLGTRFYWASWKRVAGL